MDKHVDLTIEVNYRTKGKSDEVIARAKKLVDYISGLVEDETDGFVTPVYGAAFDENDEKVEIYRDAR